MMTKTLMTVLRSHDLAPDGVRIVVDWGAMHVGTSIFVPCIDTEKAKKQIKSVFMARHWEFLSRVRVENRYLGLRVWRTM